eukprot:EG_transcript_11083
MDVLPLLSPADSTRTYVHRGKEFQQFFQLVPQFPGSYTRVEAEYYPDPAQSWMISVPWFPLLLVTLYMAMCYFGPKVMANHKPFGLRIPLILWNFLLSTFSLIGAYRTAPHLLYLIYATSLKDTICTDPVAHWGAGATGMWVQFFILSKIPELGDTIFIVLKKKPLIFLHWYHHVTVLLFCWNSYVTESASGLWFITMNYTVHAVMYGYYGAMAAKLPMRWFPSWLLTAMQIAQMVVGVVIVSVTWYYASQPQETCKNDITNLYAGAVMYFSYLLLFVKFFVDKYILGRTSSLAPARAKKE